MQIGFVGLGKMGGPMVARLRGGGHQVVGFDVVGARSDVDSLADLVCAVRRPRHIWIMVPHGQATEATVAALADLLNPGDVIVDGGNSRWTDGERRAAELASRGIGFVDCGVSGGVWGLEYGYAVMAGGAAAHIARLRPVFETLKPPGDGGFVHAGPTGAGHFAKMVHNGIEYGLMQAYAEGYELLSACDLVTDVPGVFASWTAGTVIRSWLLDLVVKALGDDPELSRLHGYADDSGEGRWTVEAAIAYAVSAPAISASVFARFASRRDESDAMKLIAALRREFGGHDVREALADAEGQADEPAPGVTPVPRGADRL